MVSSGCGHCHPMILTITCGSCGHRLGDTEPRLPCLEWHNDEEPYCLDPAYPGPEGDAVRRSSATGAEAGDVDDKDGEHNNSESRSYRDVLSTLMAMGFPKTRARVALNTINNQNIDAAVDWLNNNCPPDPEPPEPVPDPDPTWGRWRPVRSCFFPELINIPARDWIQGAAIATVKRARNATPGICCKEIMHVDVMVRLIGETTLFTVRDMPVQDNVPMKNIPIDGFVPVRSDEVAQHDARTMEEIQEDEELVEAIRRSLWV